MCDYIYFNKRANFDTFKIGDKRIILYDDHRSILNILFYAKDKGLIESTPNIISFDYHDDAVPPSEERVNKLKAFRDNNPTLKQMWDFVEFELRILDDDWLTNGCELGLINNAIIIGAVEFPNIEKLENNIYKDHKDKDHELYAISHLDISLDDRGCIGDFTNCYPYYQRVREILQFNEDNSFTFKDEVYPFILDFDLDCFSDEFVNRKIFKEI